MRDFKILSSISFIVFLSIVFFSSSQANAVNANLYKSHMPERDVRDENIQTVGWDSQNLKLQTGDTVSLRRKIEELQRQNEQLRNTISQIRANQQTAPTNNSLETKIKGLIEENKRLSRALNKNQHTPERVQTLPIKKAIDKYAIEIQKLKQKNAKLHETIKRSSKQSSVNAEALKEVEQYKTENARLRQALLNKDAINKNDDRINEIAALQKENSELALALAEATGKARELQQRASALMAEKRLNKDGKGSNSSELQSRLEITIAQNEDLKRKLETAQNQTPIVLPHTKNDEEILALKKQNASLRETIKAQNETLVASNNASKTAERLMSENLMLKRKLELTGKSSDFNGQTAQQLYDENKKLRDKLSIAEKRLFSMQDERTQMVDYIKKMKLKFSQTQKTLPQTSASNDINQSLKDALEKERARTVAYRTKIREYQEENKTLKDRLGKLSDGSTLKPRTAAFAKMDKITENGVTYIDAPYPPVNEVLPMLDENGDHMNRNDGQNNIKAEDLLSKELKPLSNQ